MSNVLTISGHGNGTGKSVIALNLAASLAVYEKKTLLIDCDPEGVITGWAGNSIYPHDLSTVMGGRVGLGDAISKTEFNFLDVVPAGKEMIALGERLSRQPANEKLLRLLIEENKEIGYEYIIIDAPSSNRFLTLSAMTAADWLISPFCPTTHSKKDLLQLLGDIRYIRKAHDTGLKIAGFLFNRCGDREEIQSFIQREDLGEIAELIYQTHIPHDSLVPRTVEQYVPLVLSDIKSPAASAFLCFAREIDSIF
ncbi:MAG: ParA family protein [Desulfobacterales bacterium]|nr:ParA family protein [Desulfobacterales bacterium]